MLINYLKLSVRLLFKNQFLSIVNIAGLSIGLATFLLRGLWRNLKLRSDQYHKDSNRILRLDVDYKWTDDNQTWNGFLGAFNWISVGNEIERTFPQVCHSGVHTRHNHVRDDNFYFVESGPNKSDRIFALRITNVRAREF